MELLHLPSIALCLAATAGPVLAAGDVWVVDAFGGAGSDFVTIQQAVNAASAGDTVLVRSGTYAPFLLIGKNLAVVADENAVVRVQGGPEVAFTPAGPPNLLHGLHYTEDPSGEVVARISTGDGGARTWVSDCSTAASRVGVTSSSVILDHCSFSGKDELQSGLSSGPTPALDQSFSFVAAFDCEFQGGAGADTLGDVGPTAGSPSVLMDNFGSLWAANSSFLGGAGGDGANSLQTGCTDPEPGGPGLSLEQGWVYRNGSLFQGGPGGAPAPFCTPGSADAGEPVQLVGTFANLLDYGAAAPSLMTPGVVREGQSLAFDWDGPAGVALLLLSGGDGFQHGTFSPLSPESMPLLLSNPISVLLVDVLATAGQAQLALQVPELGGGVESRRIFAQALHLDPQTFAVSSGGARAVVLLDGSF